MKLIPDYESAVSAILDWLEDNNAWGLDLSRIGAFGMSFGGYLAPRAAAFDPRITCAVGNGGPAYLPPLASLGRVNPIWIRDLMHVLGVESI